MIHPYLSISGHGICIGGLSIGGRSSDGSISLASYHPRGCKTWHWAIALQRDDSGLPSLRSNIRTGQWHDIYVLPFGVIRGNRWCLRVSQQDYHRRETAPTEDVKRMLADPPFDTPDEFTQAFKNLTHEGE